jgi:hypothetical protein
MTTQASPKRKPVDPARPETFVGTRWRGNLSGACFIVTSAHGPSLHVKYDDGRTAAYGAIELNATRLDDAEEAKPALIFTVTGTTAGTLNASSMPAWNDTMCLLCWERRIVATALWCRAHNQAILDAPLRGLYLGHIAVCRSAWEAGDRTYWPRPFVECKEPDCCLIVPHDHGRDATQAPTPPSPREIASDEAPPGCGRAAVKRPVRRTDFSARGVPGPQLGDLVVHVCANGHRYAGRRCICETRVKVLTARQWRSLEALRP